MQSKDLIFKIILFIILVYDVPRVQAEVCHAKGCELQIRCACCLLVAGGIVCVPCGGVDCS